MIHNLIEAKITRDNKIYNKNYSLGSLITNKTKIKYAIDLHHFKNIKEARFFIAGLKENASNVEISNVLSTSINTYCVFVSYKNKKPYKGKTLNSKIKLKTHFNYDDNHNRWLFVEEEIKKLGSDQFYPNQNLIETVDKNSEYILLSLPREYNFNDYEHSKIFKIIYLEKNKYILEYMVTGFIKGLIQQPMGLNKEVKDILNKPGLKTDLTKENKLYIKFNLTNKGVVQKINNLIKTIESFKKIYHNYLEEKEVFEFKKSNSYKRTVRILRNNGYIEYDGDSIVARRKHDSINISEKSLNLLEASGAINYDIKKKKYFLNKELDV